MAIPKIIVQSHKDPSIYENYRRTWIEQHPSYDYRFMDDIACYHFIQNQMPKLLPTYEKLPLPVQKADLFRYAYIYYYSGIYADVDTICFHPTETYIDLSKKHLVVGIEMTPSTYHKKDSEYANEYASPFQILQWTFAASPRHPALAVLLDKIVYFTQQISSEQIEACSQNNRFTLELTGSILFTQVITDFLCYTRLGNITALEQLAWGVLKLKSTRISDELINKKVKVQHLFYGSWK